MSLEGWNPRTQPLRSSISHKPETTTTTTTTTEISYEVEEMARGKEVSAKSRNKRDQAKEATTRAPTPRPALSKKKTANQPQVNRDYEFNDGDDQMWHAKWCLDSWNKPGSKTLLLFQWDCQDEPTWEPFEGHNEDSCLAADFFYWLPRRARPAGWKPPVGWEVPEEMRPPIEWFQAEQEARHCYKQLWDDKTLEAKLKSLEPLHRQIQLGSHSRSASAKIKVNGARELVRDSRRGGKTPSVDFVIEDRSPNAFRSSRGRRSNS